MVMVNWHQCLMQDVYSNQSIWAAPDGFVTSYLDSACTTHHKPDTPVSRIETSVGSQVMQLGCKHHFHADCIQPWLKLQGRAAACPLCKQLVFPSSEGQLELIRAHR